MPSPLYPARAGWSGSSNKEGDPKGLYRARAGVVRMMKRAAKSTRPLPRTRGGGSSYAVAVPAILYSAPRVRRWSGINEIEVLCPARAGWSGGELRGGSGGDLCPRVRGSSVRSSVRSSTSTMRAAVSTRLWSARVRMVDEDHAHLGARPPLLRVDGVVHGPTIFGLPRLTRLFLEPSTWSRSGYGVTRRKLHIG